MIEKPTDISLENEALRELLRLRNKHKLPKLVALQSLKQVLLVPGFLEGPKPDLTPQRRRENFSPV